MEPGLEKGISAGGVFGDGGADQTIYANGFTLGHSNADAVLRLLLNGKPTVDVNMSFTLAKTLAELLGQLVRNLEKQANMDIKTTRQIDEAVLALKSKPS